MKTIGSTIIIGLLASINAFAEVRDATYSIEDHHLIQQILLGTKTPTTAEKLGLMCFQMEPRTAR